MKKVATTRYIDIPIISVKVNDKGPVANVGSFSSLYIIKGTKLPINPAKTILKNSAIATIIPSM